MPEFSVGSSVRVRGRNPRRNTTKRVRELFGQIGRVATAYASFVAVDFPAAGSRVMFRTHEVELAADLSEDTAGSQGRRK